MKALAVCLSALSLLTCCLLAQNSCWGCSHFVYNPVKWKGEGMHLLAQSDPLKEYFWKVLITLLFISHDQNSVIEPYLVARKAGNWNLSVQQQAFAISNKWGFCYLKRKANKYWCSSHKNVLAWLPVVGSWDPLLLCFEIHWPCLPRAAPHQRLSVVGYKVRPSPERQGTPLLANFGSRIAWQLRQTSVRLDFP